MTDPVVKKIVEKMYGPDEPPIRVEPTTYEICGLPEDDENASVWTITVERRDVDSWAVCRHGRCLGKDGEWDLEPIPSSRTTRWLWSHRFSLERAVELAVEAYPHVVINGYRVVDGKLVKS